MTTIAAPTILTPDEIARLSEQDGKLYEVHRGQLVEKPMSTRANYVATRIAYQLMTTYTQTKAYIIVEQPTYCFQDPTDMRRPDVALVWAHRFPDGVDDDELYIAPDLAVEVVSPTNTYIDIDNRIEEYFSAGVPLIWVVNPVLRHVYAHSADGPVAKFRQNETIQDERLLPGLALSIATFFPDPPVKV